MSLSIDEYKMLMDCYNRHLKKSEERQKQADYVISICIDYYDDPAIYIYDYNDVWTSDYLDDEEFKV